METGESGGRGWSRTTEVQGMNLDGISFSLRLEMEPQQRIALCLPVYRTGGGLGLRHGKWRIWRVLPPLPLARQARTDAVQTHIRSGASGQTCTGGVSYVGELQAPGIAATRLTRPLKWWTATALHRALSLARRVTS